MESATHGVVKNDTLRTVALPLVENGFKTLAHDWRNSLNGINLRILAAAAAPDDAARESDFAEARRLIVEATAKITRLSEQIAEPAVSLIPYPARFLIDDLVVAVTRKLAPEPGLLDWENRAPEQKVLVDFAAFAAAVSELLENSLRHIAANSPLTVSVRAERGDLIISWIEKNRQPLSPEQWGTEPFLTNERGHIGLGIYSARRMLLAHQGSLKFHYSPSEQTLRTTLGIPLA